MEKEQKNKLNDNETNNEDLQDNSIKTEGNDEFIEDIPLMDPEELTALEKLNAIEIELQEVEILIDQLELKMTHENNQEKYLDQYYELKERYNNLLVQKKKNKIKKETKWDQLPPWIMIYGLIIFLFCLPYVGMIIWATFAGWITSVIPALSQIESSSYFLFVVLLLLIDYALPLILLFISWILYVNVVKGEVAKKVFRYIWIGQGVLTLFNGLLLLFLYIIPGLK